MSQGVEVHAGESGALAALKRAEPSEAAALAAEAALLSRALHPGVVTIIGHLSRRDGSAVLATRFVGTHSLATARLRSVERVAGVLAQVAETLADLHDRGFVHGAVDSSHVLLDGRGRAVLCGLTGVGAPADDVAALGELLADALAGHLPGEPIPERRWARRPAQPRRRREQIRALLCLADQARLQDPARRPSARSFAHQLRDLVPTAPTVVDSPGPDAPTQQRDAAPRRHVASTPSQPPSAERAGTAVARTDDDRPRRRLAAHVLVVATAAAGLAFGALGLLALGAVSGHRASIAEGPATAMFAEAADPHVETAAPDPVKPPATATPEPPEACPVPSAARPDPDGDGCGDDVVIGHDEIAWGQRRWSLERAGDAVALGDWGCEGTATPAVLRAGSGEVFVFDRWAGPGEEVVARSVGVVPGAVSIADPGPGEACARIEVIDDHGDRHLLEVPAGGS